MEKSFISSGPPYTCDICNKTFGRTAYLYRHLRKHTGEFTCTACRAVFARKETLQSHDCSAQPMHSDEITTSRLSCPFCQKQFAARKQLTRHIAKHAVSRRFQCSKCDKSFSSKETVQQHLLKCSGSPTPPSNDQSRCSGQDETQQLLQDNSISEPNAIRQTKKLSCDLCQRVFPSQTALLCHKVTQHKDSHLEDTCIHCGRVMTLASPDRLEQHARFCAPAAALQVGNAVAAICPDCNESFQELVLYRHHVYRHTHSFACAHCQRAFGSLQERGRHVCLDHLEQCAQCGRRFETVLQLERHVITHGVPDHYCFECGRSFHQMNDFIQHRCFELNMKIFRQLSNRASASAELSSSPIVSSSSSSSTKYVNDKRRVQNEHLMCEICGEVVKKRCLKAHRSVHGERNIVCQVCGKRFHRKDVLLEHMYVHEDAQLRCSICNKLLKSKKSLDAHMRRHTGHKRFSCQKCGKEFFQKINYQKHMKRHDPRPEPVGCPHCHRRFQSPETLAKHVREHMEGSSCFRCKQCNNIFAKEEMLHEHMKLHNSSGHSCPACGHILKYRNSLRRHILKNHPELSKRRKTGKENPSESAPCLTEQPQSPEVLLTVSQLQLTTDGMQHLSIPGGVSIEGSCILEEGTVECSEDMVLYVLQDPQPCVPLQEPSTS